jgi:hypothetical protein
MVKRRKTKELTKTKKEEVITSAEDTTPDKAVEEVVEEVAPEGMFASDVERLEFKITTMDIAALEKDAKILKQQINILEHEKMLTSLKVSDVNARLVQKKRDSNLMLEGIAKKVGMTAKSISLDVDTGEIKT